MTKVFEQSIGMIPGLFARLEQVQTAPRGLRPQDSEERFLDMSVEDYTIQRDLMTWWA